MQQMQEAREKDTWTPQNVHGEGELNHGAFEGLQGAFEKRHTIWLLT